MSDLYAASRTVARPRTTREAPALLAPRPFDPRDHRCHCGAWGSFGQGHTRDQPGLWYCSAHNPDRGRGAQP